MPECDADEILRQLKVLGSLKELRENMGNNFFLETFPELTNVGSRLDTVIAEQESLLQETLDKCGKVGLDEIPTDVDVETITDIPEVEIPEIEIPEVEEPDTLPLEYEMDKVLEMEEEI